MLILPATPDTVAGFIAAAEAAPEELSTIANVMPCPPMPFVSAEHHGELVVFGIIVCAGDPAAAERAVAPFRALGDAARRPGPPDAPTPRSTRPRTPTTTRPRSRGRCSSTTWTTRSPTIVDRLRGVGRVDARRPAARARRRDGARPGRRHGVRASGRQDHGQHRGVLRGPGRQAAPRGMGRPSSPARSTRATTAPTSTSSATRASSGSMPPIRAPTWDRLAAVKARYDPTNLFHRNQNIPPSA